MTSRPWLLGQRGAVLPQSPSPGVSAEGREAREKVLPSRAQSPAPGAPTLARSQRAHASVLWAGALQDRGAGACSRLRPPQAGTAPSALGVRRGVDGVSLFPGWLRLLCQRSGKRGREAFAPNTQLRTALWVKGAFERCREGAQLVPDVGSDGHTSKTTTCCVCVCVCGVWGREGSVLCTRAPG